MWCEMRDDVPGTRLIPDPSLGVAPHARGPATHRRGVARPADRACAGTGSQEALTTLQLESEAASRRSRGLCDLPPGFRPPSTSGRGCARSRGVRHDRGEPLLLGVDEEYQISYRLFGTTPGAFLKKKSEEPDRPALTDSPKVPNVLHGATICVSIRPMSYPLDPCERLAHHRLLLLAANHLMRREIARAVVCIQAWQNQACRLLGHACMAHLR
jgi:hypothetical protein